ncbi:MAG: hypothetical protein GTO76_08340 [Planctomycetales bacterium]|nr:hypothetical protein [Planctomycetales bacterium]NIP04826.1 hypothetical protein [Planctomycetales bacterium]NIP69887.1 hypothetical protein [Planctomycetales bacterium]
MVDFEPHLPADEMHARDLVELAAIVAAHGPLLLESPLARLSDQNLKRYWSASKCRFDRWGMAFKDLRDVKTAAGPRRRARALIEEIFASEALTRVWTAAATAFDHQRGGTDVESIVSSVLTGQLEARHRALRFLADSQVSRPPQARQLARLHRRLARWVDLLVAHLQRYHEVSRYAMQPDRCRDFAADLERQGLQTGSRYAWRLTFSSMRQTLCRPLSPTSPNADLNFQIAGSIISCFDTRDFEAFGALRSVWLIRLLDTSTLCESLVDHLLADR